MVEKVSWMKNGNLYQRVEGNVANIDQIPQGIYKIQCIPMKGWFLHHYADKFTFDYKIYGLENDFYNHVLKAYRSTRGNFGVLMNGTKGTGKSVTAKMLANAFNLPVIIVEGMGDDNPAMFNYISSFNFDCVLFMDEFEKNFKKEDSSVLQIMDGAYNSPHRRIFLLTTNETNINNNLVSRPSRLRYIHEFGNLKSEVVKEYLEDNLDNLDAIPRLMSFIDTLSISTIDILKTIVEDINIFGIETFLKNKEFFNVKVMHYYYEIRQLQININRAQELNFDIPKFLEVLELENQLRNINIVEGESWESFKDRRKEFKHKHALDQFDIEWFDSTSTDCPYTELLEGSDFNDSKVIKVDTKNHVIVSLDRDNLFFSLVLNPDESPSLYKTTKSAQYLLA